MYDSVPHILIADDDADLRAILVDFLAPCGYEVWPAASGQEALAVAQSHALDIALIDVVMPDLSGVELIPQLQSLWPEITIILLTAYGTISQAVEAIRLGAFDYLEKPISIKHIQAMVEKIWRLKQTRAQTLSSLTKREHEVLSLLADGKTDAEIAEVLCLSMHTVNSHLRKIFLKLEVNNRTQAAAIWHQSGSN